MTDAQKAGMPRHSPLAKIAIAELQRQRCKVCWKADGFYFQIPDEVWAAVLPEPLRHRVVCLKCFDQMASEAGVEYASHLRRINFVGESASFEFEVRR